MRNDQPFCTFDPLLDPIPPTPFGKTLSIIAVKARRLLIKRTSEQVVDAAATVIWMLDEYFEKAAVSNIRQIGKIYGLKLEHFTPGDTEIVDVIGWLLDGADKPARSGEGKEISRLAELIPTPENTNPLDALQGGLELFELDDDLFPDAQEWEYFAVLALLLLSKAIGQLNKSAQNQIMHVLTAPPATEHIGKAGELSILAMQAACSAHELMLTDKISDRSFHRNLEYQERHVKEHSLKQRRMKGLQLINEAKSRTKLRAKEIATNLWGEDTKQIIRIGDMADQVYRALVDEGLTENLPGTPEQIRSWIKSVAPGYSRKPGRARKSPNRNG